jgi:hypothetical protein
VVINIKLGGIEMAKTRHINLRIPEDDFKGIEAMLSGKTLTQFFRDLVKLALEKEREDANSFLQLMQKIDASDLSKINEKLDKAMETLELLKPKPRTVPSAAERLEARLDELSLDIADCYEAAIVLMERNDRAGTNFAQSFMAKRRKIRQEKERKDD